MVRNIGLVDSKDCGKWKMPTACVTPSLALGYRWSEAARIIFPFFKIRINYYSLWNERERLITT